MKTPLLLCFLGFSSLLSAATQETPEEILLTGDYTQDGLPDLIIIHRETGAFRVGAGDAAGVLTWEPSRDSGVTNVSAALLANVLFTPGNELLLTQETLNQGVALSHGSEDWTKAALDGAGHTLLAAGLANPFGGTTAVLVGTRASFSQGIGLGGDPPSPNQVFHQNLTSTFGFNAAGTGFAGVPRHGERLTGAMASHQILWREMDAANPLLSELRVVSVQPGPFGTEITSLATAWLGGEIPDYAVAPAAPAASEHWVFAWNRGQPMLRQRSLTTEPTTTFAEEQLFNQPQNIDFAMLLPRAEGPPRVAVSLDQGAMVRIYDFDGSALTLRQSLMAEGGRRTSALLPWGNADGFTLLSRAGLSGPSTHVTRYQPDGSGQYQPLGTDALSTVILKPIANVFAWSGEPMVDPTVRLLSQRRAGDWSNQVSSDLGGPFGQPSVTAMSENFVSSAAGLSQLMAVPAGSAPPFTTHLSGNQASPMMSVYGDSGPRTVGDFDIEMSPPPGRYDVPSLTITLKVSAVSGLVQGYYKVANGAWQQTLESLGQGIDFKFTLTRDATVQAYAVRNGGFGPSMKTQIISAAYTLGAAVPVPVRATLDENGDGIGDEWARLFGITDPTADDDGDGQSNFAEFNAGTDPRDASQFYIPAPTLPELSLLLEPDGAGGYCICARWTAADPSVRLEYASTLGTAAVWQPVTFGRVSLTGMTRVFTTVPEPGELARFFRLARY